MRKIAVVSEVVVLVGLAMLAYGAWIASTDSQQVDAGRSFVIPAMAIVGIAAVVGSVANRVVTSVPATAPKK